MNSQADPLAHDMRGRDLAPGMATYYRVQDKSGNVSFRFDCLLIEELDNTGCPQAVHFLTADNKRVCYYLEGRVWAKKTSEAERERLSRGNSRNYRESPDMADSGNGRSTLGNKRQANSRKTKAPGRSRDNHEASSKSELHGRRTKQRSPVEHRDMERDSA